MLSAIPPITALKRHRADDVVELVLIVMTTMGRITRREGGKASGSGAK